MSRRLVKFHMRGCIPCRATAPIVEKLAKQHDLSLIEIDLDEDPEAKADYDIFSVPTVILLDGDVEVGRAVGAMPLAKLKASLGL